jgi:hypothetical protein
MAGSSIIRPVACFVACQFLVIVARTNYYIISDEKI